MVKLTCVVHQEGDVAVHPCSEPSDVKYDIHSSIEVTGSEVTHGTGVEGKGASQQGRHAAEDILRTAFTRRSWFTVTRRRLTVS